MGAQALVFCGRGALSDGEGVGGNLRRVELLEDPLDRLLEVSGEERLVPALLEQPLHGGADLRLRLRGEGTDPFFHRSERCAWAPRETSALARAAARVGGGPGAGAAEAPAARALRIRSRPFTPGSMSM